MKQCCECRELLPLSSFNKNRAKRDGLAGMCRECWKIYYKQNYYLRGNEKERLKKNRKTRYETFRAMLNGLKDVPCKDCGGIFPPYAMDFDHVNEKLFSMGGSFENSEAEDYRRGGEVRSRLRGVPPHKDAQQNNGE